MKRIDGLAFLFDLDDNDEQKLKKAYFSVKSNKTLSPTVIRDLYGTMKRDKAVMGYFITLYPMKNLIKESKKYGLYENKLTGTKYPTIRVVSVEEILSGERLKIPSATVVKSAKRDISDTQTKLDL